MTGLFQEEFRLMESKINALTAMDLINQEIVGIRHILLPPTHVRQDVRYFFQLSNKTWFEMLEYNPWATEFRIPVVDEATISKRSWLERAGRERKIRQRSVIHALRHPRTK